KGILPKANRHGPQPGQEPPDSVREYIGGLLQGTLSIIQLERGEKFEEQMKRYTARAYRCLPSQGRASSTNVPAGNPIPTRPGEPTPIKYVIYVIKENRTYDQVL